MNIKTANRLVDLRKKHGYSQEELASALNLSRQTISKWERSEASPDTDNLIALANLYGMSLDDLLGINDEKYDEEDLSSSTDQSSDDPHMDKEEKEEDSEEKKTHIHISDEGITVNDVHIDSSGVYGEGFSVTGKGIKVKKDKTLPDDDMDNYTIHVDYEDEFKDAIRASKKWTYQLIVISVLRGVSLLACLVAFLLVGFLVEGGWSWGWTLIFAFDIIPSLVSAIMKRRFCSFNIALTICLAYFLPGMLLGAWHPNWVLFLIIPLYYIVFGPIDNMIWMKRVTKWSKENIIDGKGTIE